MSSNLAAAAATLKKHGLPADAAGRLARFLEAAPGREVSHANPRLLAERLGLIEGGERAVLKLVVAALYEGLVTLHWDVRCPACGAVADHTGLPALHHTVQCAMCQGQFAPRLDNEVHVTFSVHPRFRPLSAETADEGFRAAVDARLGPVPGQALLLLPDFQRLFPQERLLPDESLEVARVALVFTDLAGSTALYAQRGDPRAYHLVRLHFEELFTTADRRAGTVVKNIGDAVMAAFQTPAAALAAALEMQAAIAGLNRRERLSVDERLVLKVGLHSGPCLNVTLNDRLDYFGTTVNIAARVQGLSYGGDVVFTDAVRDDPESQPLLSGRVLRASQAAVKGIEGEINVYRLPILRPPAG
jgi:class 3 adenylate cyclase